MATITKLSFDEVRALPIREKIEYQKRLNTERQRQYRQNNKEKLKVYNKDYAKKYKEANYEKVKEMSRKNSKLYREKMRRFKAELVAEDIINDIINHI